MQLEGVPMVKLLPWLTLSVYVGLLLVPLKTGHAQATNSLNQVPAQVTTPTESDPTTETTAATEPAAVAEPTVAEQSGYTETANGAQVESYLRRLASNWTAAELTTIGQTTEGRPLWAIDVPPPTGLEQASSQTLTVQPKALTVLVLGGIHSGECDGKEAILALARDMAAGRHGDWWQSLRLIFVPNFNADGNERRGLEHRPGQEGPGKGMGIRENAQGLDLNRDFIKLESPEVRGLVAAMNEFDVDVLIDTHTTNGSLHQYELTYDVPHNPAAPADVRSWLRSTLIPTVNRRMRDKGFETFYYGNFDREHRRWSTYGHEPRYSTDYMGLRGKIGILSESYSYASYQTRVEASYAFVLENLRMLAEEQSAVRKLIDAATVDAQPGASLPLRAEIVKTADNVTTKGFATAEGNTPTSPFNAEKIRNSVKKDYSVQLWNRTEPTKSVTLPHSYVIPPQYAWAASRLQRHGVQMSILTAAQTVPAEIYTFDEVKRAREFQQHRMLTVSTKSSSREVLLEVGSYVVPTAQPLGKLAAYLLEPEADDSLVVWNFFDPDIEAGAEYPVLRLPTAVDEAKLGALQSVLPTESITLARLFDPEKSVDYDGGTIRGAKWLKNSSEYVLSSNGRSFAVDAKSGSMRRLDEMDTLRVKLAALEAFSSDEAAEAATIDAFTDDWQFALVSHRNDLYFFSAQDANIRQLTHSADKQEQLAELSPDGQHVAFVRDNNLWVVNCETTELRQLTDDGSTELLNGILDWVYQEELYGRGKFKAFWWSPDAQQIAFLKLDQTPVPSYQVSDSISFGQTLEATRYPKAGEPLPNVDVCIVDLASSGVRTVDLSEFDPADRLIGRVTWSPAGQVWLQVLNRVQNRLDLLEVDPSSLTRRTVFTEASPGWIEIRGVPEFLPGGDFLWLSDLPEGRTHLWRVDAQSGQRRQLTVGDWDVSGLLSISADSKRAFVAGNVTSPIESQLLAVDLETSTMQQLTSSPGTHSTQVDAAGEYFIDVFSSTDTPTFASVHSIDGALLRVIEAPTTDRPQFLNLQPPQTFTITARDGLPLQAQLLLPPDFNPDTPTTQGTSAEGVNAALEPATKLPVVVFVYGGPQAPTVKHAWAGRNYWWHQMLCQRGFAVLLCDNRAARGRGVKDTWTIRGDLCRVELQDLEDAVGWLTNQPWADADRIGLWGWSYGGYFTSYALTHSDLFKCGIAGAPVTDWRNYDAIYTERYMDLPEKNPDGYRSSSPVEAAANLSGNLLILHGEKDDNVHISNSLQLAYALQKAGKSFEMMIYPKNRHGIVDAEQKFHMHTLMTDFFHKHLMPDAKVPK